MVDSLVVKMEKVEKVYRLGTVMIHALRGVSLDVSKGEFIVVMGSSGSGKTTILMWKELPNDAHMITIEINNKAALMAEENIKRAEIPSTMEILVGKAVEVIPKLKGEFDMVFLDAVKVNTGHILSF